MRALLFSAPSFGSGRRGYVAGWDSSPKTSRSGCTQQRDPCTANGGQKGGGISSDARRRNVLVVELSASKQIAGLTARVGDPLGPRVREIHPNWRISLHLPRDRRTKDHVPCSDDDLKEKDSQHGSVKRPKHFISSADGSNNSIRNINIGSSLACSTNQHAGNAAPHLWLHAAGCRCGRL